jgi:hypothetical protein
MSCFVDPIMAQHIFSRKLIRPNNSSRGSIRYWMLGAGSEESTLLTQLLKPITIASTVLVLLITSAFLVYLVSLFPAYEPYQLNEQFDRLDPDVWEIGGAGNFTVTDGVLNLFDSTSARHYFVTNPKWGSYGWSEPNLQGSIEITFRINALLGRSLVVASTDSWRVYVANRTLMVETTDRPGRVPFLGGILDSSMHRLMTNREANSLQFHLDESPLFQIDDFSGSLKWIELGTVEGTVGGFQVQGELSVDSVTAKLQPLLDAGQSIGESPLQFATISLACQHDACLNRDWRYSAASDTLALHVRDKISENIPVSVSREYPYEVP